MKAIRFLSATAAVACLAFASACSDYVGKEATHPLYAKAMSAKTSKSYRESADSLEEFLVICPKSPKAHYDVALLYKENLENYPAAIYHLQKYLDLMGETLPKDDQAAIRRYIQDCERQMFELYRVRNDVKLADDVPQVDPAKLTAKNNEIAALREKIQKYIDNEKLILAQNQELRNRSPKPRRPHDRRPPGRRRPPQPLPPVRLRRPPREAALCPPPPLAPPAPRSPERTASATTTWRKATVCRPSRRRCTARRPCGRSFRTPTRKPSANAAS